MKFYTKHAVKFIFSLTFLTIVCFNSFAQTTISPLFIPISKDVSNVSASQVAFFDKSQADELTVYQQLVQIGDVQTFLENGLVSFQFPNISDVLTAKTNYSVQSESEGSVWNGVFPDEKGDITIISKGSERYGGITYGSHYYSFEDIGNGIALIREVATPDNGHALDIETSIPPSITVPPSVSICERPKVKDIDILFLYAEGTGKISTINQAASSIITEMNLITNNSKIFARFHNVGVEPAPYNTSYISKGFNQGEVTNWATNQGNVPAVKSLREARKADIVIVLYKAPTKYKDANGYVYGADGGFGKATSYVVAHIDYVTNSKYQTAMLGTALLMGAGSERRAGLYTYAKPKIYNSKYTVVHEGVPQNKSKYISNPLVKDGSSTTGDKDKKDNSKSMNLTACTVEGYFDPKVNVAVELLGEFCKFKPTSAYVYVTGLEINEYCLSHSLDGGVTYSTFKCQKVDKAKPWLAATFNIPATGSGTIYVKTIVKEANGYFKETISVIILTNCLDNPTLNRQFKENSIKNVFISPNPTQGDFVTLITGFKDKSVKINLIDAKSSSILSTLDKNIDSDEYNQDFDTSNLTNGLYFLQLISGEIIITKKIIIAHD